jgi:RHS repeat-associated protein
MNVTAKRTKLMADPFTNEYDNASRLLSVTDGSGYSANYTYLANSSLIGEIQFEQSGFVRMATRKQYDLLNRLTVVSNVPSGSGQVPMSYAYSYNDANQRVEVDLADASWWNYGYDSLGQVTSGKRFWSDASPVAGEQLGYAFDNIGNRVWTTAGGDNSGANLRSATYTANSLNQYSSRTVPGAFDVVGVATATASVNVNGQIASRKGEFYHASVPVSNSGAPVFQSIAEVATASVGTSSTTNSGSFFVPPTPEAFTYDLDGNSLTDGRWTYTWDGENRLVNMVANTNVPSAARFSIAFTYDSDGRRIQEAVSSWNGSSYIPSCTRNVLFDGWNMIIEMNGLSTNAILRQYVWAGDNGQFSTGVGDVLSVGSPGSDKLFVACDGNGNVSTLVDATTGASAGTFVYGPMAELLQISPAGTNNPCPLRFGGKYCDDESGFYYYGYRYVNPALGKWLSRDPNEEAGGPGLYLFTENDQVDKMDPLGLGVNDPPHPLSAPPPQPTGPSVQLGGAWADQRYYTGWAGNNAFSATLSGSVACGCLVPSSIKVVEKVHTRTGWTITLVPPVVAYTPCGYGMIGCYTWTKTVSWMTNPLIKVPFTRQYALRQNITLQLSICGNGSGWNRRANRRAIGRVPLL